MPENVVFLDEWQRILGDGWLFLHVVRNPLAALASIEEQGFPRSIPSGLDERIDLYLEYAEAGLRFAEEHPDRYVRLLYEDLVGDPEARVRELMAELGEEFQPAQPAINVSPHRSGLEDPKAAAASRIHTDSVKRWRQVLGAEEVRRIEERTAATWSRPARGRASPT